MGTSHSAYGATRDRQKKRHPLTEIRQVAAHVIDGDDHFLPLPLPLPFPLELDGSFFDVPFDAFTCQQNRLLNICTSVNRDVLGRRDFVDKQMTIMV